MSVLTMAAERPRFQNEAARDVAQDFIDALSDSCERVQIAGSLRRRKPYVKDVEIVFVPKLVPDSNHRLVYSDFFRDPSPPPLINLAELAIANLLAAGLIWKRPNINGVPAW